ncbi:MAG: hypothetical protein HQL97_01485 [Magnetococcales bacterium]|nr:hypothetical protein [Magnetococcales bacterium]
MSEYQYYEFLAVDRPLNEQEIEALRALSSRARITATSFVNHYDFGDFKGNPDRLVERYFDFFLYLANWGSRCFMLRVPARLLKGSLVQPYCPGDNAEMRQVGGNLILDYTRDEDGEDWDWNDDGRGRMAALAPVRTALLRGDLRLLYLGWLLAAQEGVLEDEAVEPDAPPGLAQLDGPLLAFVDFMGIDRDLVAAAASGDQPAIRRPLSRDEIMAALRGLSDEEKNAFLLRMALGEESHVGLELLRRLEGHIGKGASTRSASSSRRTVGELFALADTIRDARQRREAERKASERARQVQQQAAAREKHLKHLSGREEKAWVEVEVFISERSAAQYDQAAALLVDLRELATRSGQTASFIARIAAIRQEHARKSSLIERLDKAGLR